jgi:predicted amidophosphoribosyltransferase
MLCVACARPGWPLCESCQRGLIVAHDRITSGIPVGVAFEHRGTAVRLVHNLKYRRSLAAGQLLAQAMAPRVPAGATVLVPVRRSLVRRVVFGIDQASVLARQISAIVELPVADVLRPPMWWSQRAGAPRSERRPIGFVAASSLPDGAVLIDDVLTTGSTIVSAGHAIGPSKYSSLVATAAGMMGAGVEVAPSLGGDVADKRRTNTDRAPAAQVPPNQSILRGRGFVAPPQRVPTERRAGDRSHPR